MRGIGPQRGDGIAGAGFDPDIAGAAGEAAAFEADEGAIPPTQARALRPARRACSSAPEGRKNVAHGVSRRELGTRRAAPRSYPEPLKGA